MKKNILGDRGNYYNYIAEISSKRKRHLGCSPLKLLGIIFEVDEGGNSIKGTENKKTPDDE